jgi:protein-L-isoaspartate(D-aspartate) O-methyltransferase
VGRPDRPRVLLLWPGALYGGGGNFGVPQLLSIAAAVRAAGAEVDVVDLDLERALGRVDLDRILAGPYDLVGLSCYSSFDYLKVVELARRVRARLPRAWVAVGGYHASARPSDFTGEAEDETGLRPEGVGTLFDFVVVGDGEGPMARLASALGTGKRPLVRVLGPESVADPNELPPLPWELLERYRAHARRVASQAEVYLSRGCPYDCAFCMERAKRDVSWRALDPERAVEEMHRLDAFLDLSRWTLFVADALFGMKSAWRKQFLEALARRPIRAQKTWLLIRIDLVDEDDLRLMARANVAPGFGLESGDPEHLRRIRKAGRLSDMLEKMLRVADWARTHQVPFGANVIVGHPGETEATLRTSAAYLRKLFVEHPAGTMGFLSVDPFRLYPGSPIDEERAEWEAETGFRAHRYPWLYDGDQELLSEWVDPSASLDFRTAQRLRRELFGPIAHAIGERFAYRGVAKDYFRRAVDEQIALVAPRRALHELGLFHLWSELLEKPHVALEDDEELARTARARREETLRPDLPFRDVLVRVPRERFVRVEDVARSAEDVALALDDAGASTISAMHAYAASFDALELGPGDALVELGAGTGYGCAVAAEIVGGAGRVLGVEIDGALATRAATLLSSVHHAQVERADAHDVHRWQGATKVSVAFAVAAVPQAWLEALAPGGRLVAPVGGGHAQRLLCFDKGADGAVTQRELGAVRYVPDRSTAASSSAASAPSDARSEGGARSDDSQRA